MNNIIKSIKEFGFKFTTNYLYFKVLKKLTGKHKYKEKGSQNIIKYLYKNYYNLLPNDTKVEMLDSDFKVWIFWWQGKESMPDIVKACFNSVQKIYTNRVVLITKENFKQYVDIPNYILEKLDKKIMTITHFSDILRACLLSIYGGIWLDATIYLAGDITQDLINLPFYTNNIQDGDKYNGYVSKGRWSAFFMSGAKNNPIFVGLRDIFFEYWKTHNYLIDYFLIDYCICMMYDNVPVVKELIDKVPVNNKEIHTFLNILFEKYDKNLYNQLTKTTKIFKLSWKISEEDKNIEGTFYKHILGEK